jgi:hypothetical protein
LASLVTGAIAGIPAVILGRLAAREIQMSGGTYLDDGDARAGFALGVVGTIVSLTVLADRVAAESVPAALVTFACGVAGYGALLVGARWRAAPQPLRALSSRSGWPLWLAIAGALLAGSAGLWEKRADDDRLRREAAVACANEMQALDAAANEHRFDDARTHASKARAVCIGQALGHIQGAERRLPEEEAAYRSFLEQQHAEQEAEAAAERERQAQADFDQRNASLQSRFAAIQADAARAQWIEARDQVNQTAADLEFFRGTHVTSSAAWLQFASRLEALSKTVLPKAEQAERARAAAEEAARRREEARQKAAEAAAAAREASRPVLCCDGWVSGCLCAAPSHRGCCSWHHGICGCAQ